MNLETSKNLGGIGALLLLIGIIPFFQYSWIISIVGIILVLAGLNGLANYYNSRSIFRNALWGVIIAIIGVIVAIGTFVAAVLANLSSIKDFLYQIYPGWNGDWSSLSGMTPDTSTLTSTEIIPFLTSVALIFFAVLAVVCIFLIIATFFLRRSLKEVADRSNVGTFGTAGTLLLIGAVLTIVLFGFVLMWIGALILAIAFFTLKPQPTQQPMATTYPPPPPTPV